MNSYSIVNNFLFTCRSQKNLNEKTIKAYKYDLLQFQKYLNNKNISFGDVCKNEVKDYLKTIAQLSRMLQKEEFRNKLMKAKKPLDVLAAIGDAEKKLNRNI